MSQSEGRQSEGRATVETPHAPAAIGPYSQAVIVSNLMFCSGMLPIVPESGDLVEGGVREQTSQCLENLAALCRVRGSDLNRALRLTVYTTKLQLFDDINDSYRRYFSEMPPARVTVGVAALPKGADVEIDAIVIVDG
jgi:2-iminobutanoate/2-iminopropanoate deaminase